MPPFRPANLNKRAYPGNASVIGPTRTATCGVTTTTCCSSTTSCSACSVQNVLGCRCTFCACPCCSICCSCPQTLCTRTVPSGRWRVSEQNEARNRDAWGSNTCTCGGSTCLCCTNVGVACTGVTGIADCKGFFICCGPTTNKWFVAPACTEVIRSWYSTGDAVTVADSCMGACGWFVPDIGQLSNPGFSCRAYWDSYSTGACAFYWSTTSHNTSRAPSLNISTGQGCNDSPFHPYINKAFGCCVRAFRCTAS